MSPLTAVVQTPQVPDCPLSSSGCQNSPDHAPANQSKYITIKVKVKVTFI